MGYEGSPKVSPSIPFGSMGKKTGSSLVATSPASTAGTGVSSGGGVGSGGSNSAGGQSGTSGNGGSSANSGGMSTPVPSAVY